MINVFGPRTESVWGPVEKELGHGFAGLPVDNVGVQYGLAGLQGRGHHPRPVRRPQREDRRRGHRPQRDEGAHPRGRTGRQVRLPVRRRQRGQQPHRRGDHRPARARPGRVPRRLPLVVDARAPGTRRGSLPEERRDLVRGGAPDRLSDLHHRSAARDGPLAVGGGGRQAQDHARRKGRGRPPGRSPRQMLERRRRRRSLGARRRAGVPAAAGADPFTPRGRGRVDRPTTRNASSSRSCSRTTTRSRSQPNSGRSYSRRSPRASATSRSRASASRTRCPGGPTRTTPAAEPSSTAASRWAKRPRTPAKGGRVRSRAVVGPQGQDRNPRRQNRFPARAPLILAGSRADDGERQRRRDYCHPLPLGRAPGLRRRRGWIARCAR